MPKTKRVMLLILLLLSTINTSLTKVDNFGYEKKEYNRIHNDLLSTHINMKGPSVRTHNEKNANLTNLDLGKLRRYILDNLVTEMGGFPLSTTGDGFINTTYFGTITIYALGGLSEYIDKLKTWLNYSYDEETYGFRTWLGDNVSFIATLWGLLILNFTGIEPTGFNFNATVEYINSTLETKSVDELDLISSSLLLRVLSIFHYKLSGAYISTYVKALQAHLFDFYDQQTGLFYDPNIHLGEIIQTYLCVNALVTANKTIINSTIAQKVADALLERRYVENNTMLSAFHSKKEKPNVFETGLATDMLMWFLRNDLLDTETSTLLSNDTFWSNITAFVNKSQDTDGGITSSPETKTKSILHAFGAILVLTSLGLLKNEARIHVDIKPDEQIAIDYNGTIIAEINAEILGENLHSLAGYFVVRNTFNNISYFGVIQERDSTYVANISSVINATFGVYHINVTLLRDIGLNNITLTSSTSFRIGYLIDANISSVYISPSDNVTINIHVKFYNGSYINNSNIIIQLQHAKEPPLINETENLNASPITKDYTFPPNASLGKYVLTLTINDSYGFNHTFKSIDIYVSDDLDYEILHNRTEYYLGETIIIFLRNITYKTSQYPISTNANLSSSITTTDGEVLSRGNASWIFEESFVNINITLIAPRVIPDAPNVTIRLQITWDETTYGTRLLLLFNATLKISKFYLSNISFYKTKDNETFYLEKPIFYIGETYNISFKLIHIANRSGLSQQRQYICCAIENATINLHIKEENKTWFSNNVSFNLEKEVYNTSFYIDPNMPSKNYTIQVQIFLDFNQTWINYSFPIFVLGVPRMINSSFPFPAISNHIYLANFSLICNETNKTLEKVNLIANVTFIFDEENITITIPITVEDEMYRLSFDVQPAKYLLIKIFRTSDDLNIANILVNVIEKKEQITFDLWISLPILIVIAYIAYIFTRLIYSRKISRRYLIERSKKLL